MALTQEQLNTILTKQAQARIAEMDYETLFEYSVMMFKREHINPDTLEIDQKSVLWDVYDSCEGDELTMQNFLTEQCGIPEDQTDAIIEDVNDTVKEILNEWFVQE
jgi:hypothetical protein